MLLSSLNWLITLKSIVDQACLFQWQKWLISIKEDWSPLTFLTQHTLGKESSISFLIIYFGQLGLCWTLVLMTISVIWFGKWRTTNHLRCLSWSKQQNPSPRALQGWNYFFCLFPMTESELVPVKLMSFITTLLYCPSIKDVQPW